MSKKPNVKLMKRVLSYIRRYPEKHDQTSWCGSSRCFAGWACYLEGWCPAWENKSIKDTNIVDWLQDVEKDGMIDTARTVAMSLLQIDEHETEMLFKGSRDIHELGQLVEHIEEHGNLLDFCWKL